MDGSRITAAITYELQAGWKDKTPISKLEELEMYLMLELKRIQRVLHKARTNPTDTELAQAYVDKMFV